MTAAVPDPRFRDQLAEDAYMPLRRAFCERGIAAPDIAALDSDVSYVAGRLSDALMPLIAAEVEARVQAAAAPLLAKLRAVEALAEEAEKVREHNARTFGLKPLPARVGTDELRRALGAS